MQDQDSEEINQASEEINQASEVVNHMEAVIKPTETATEWAVQEEQGWEINLTEEPFILNSR